MSFIFEHAMNMDMIFKAFDKMTVIFEMNTALISKKIHKWLL